MYGSKHHVILNFFAEIEYFSITDNSNAALTGGLVYGKFNVVTNWKMHFEVPFEEQLWFWDVDNEGVLRNKKYPKKVSKSHK